MAGAVSARWASAQCSDQVWFAACAQPVAPGLELSWADLLLIALAIVPAVFFALSGHRGGGPARVGCLGVLLRLVTLWAGSTVMAYPAGVVMYLGTTELGRHPEAWAMTAVSPFAALAVAWWFQPVFPPVRLPYLLLRAGLLLAACTGAVLAADRSGLPVTTAAGIGAGAALAATLASVAVWWAADRLPPLWQAVGAVTLLGVCIGAGVTTEADGILVLTGRQAGSGMVLWAAFLLAVLQVAAVVLLCLAGWRLAGQLRTGTLGRRAADRSQGLWPPRPGQVWHAEVPFREDGSESKDRPVLVLRAFSDHAEVLKITSQDKTGHHGHLHLPLAKWHKVLEKESWLELRVTPLAYGNFYNLRGLCRYGVWREVRRRDFSPGKRSAGTGRRR
ncbi:hypothetical protein HS041_07765 [Planomonospora sp. ID67723]|uniref:hypothetical protein n=1 Tax=Planomonospora sp. ID67723 TaxID=2738134 RepID=UPI0018C35A06|nr:hypothetical protein [Planomonospora sp. ID67723]MBG0827657.1 hypothetical protein [Planomonospora sp. ID67723]